MPTWIRELYSASICAMLIQTSRVQRLLIDQKIRALPRDLPVFLYKGSIYDPEDREAGLCLGELLVTVSFTTSTCLAYRILCAQSFRRLYGTYEQALESPDTPVKLQGRLLEYALNTITPAMVAYAAIQVCF
jgi:hypothetical protein